MSGDTHCSFGSLCVYGIFYSLQLSSLYILFLNNKCYTMSLHILLNIIFNDYPIFHHLFNNFCVAQLCSTLWGPMDYSLLWSSVHGILQARILAWIAIPSPGDLPILGIEVGSPALQADSLWSELPGKCTVGLSYCPILLFICLVYLLPEISLEWKYLHFILCFNMYAFQIMCVWIFS